MRFSILLATLDRTAELRQLLDSLAAQTLRSFELIVIDQNADDRLLPILQPYTDSFSIRRLRSRRGHSRALNLGLSQASGDFVCFPDDDSWYDPSTLARVAEFLDRNSDVCGITGREIVAPEFTSGSRWDLDRGRVTRANVWRRAITFTIFLRRQAAVHCLFDETLGVGAGSPWGAGEETDYLLRLIAHGRAIHYDPALTVWHQGRSGPFTREMNAKAHHYAMGIGRVLRLNHFDPGRVAYQCLRPLGGAVLSLARGRAKQASYHWSIFRGRVRGWAMPLPRPAAGAVRAPRPEANA